MCVLKNVDIFIDWPSWSVNGPIILSNLWFGCGLSSNQVRTNDARNVVLFVVDPSSIHHYIFWSDQCYHLVHLVVEFHFMVILINCCWAHRQHPYPLHDFFGHQAGVGNFCKHYFVIHWWTYVWMKGVTSSNSCAFGASCRRGFEKVNVASYGIIPSQSCIRAKYSVVWRLATFIPYVSRAHQATDWFVQGEEVPS